MFSPPFLRCFEIGTWFKPTEKCVSGPSHSGPVESLFLICPEGFPQLLLGRCKNLPREAGSSLALSGTGVAAPLPPPPPVAASLLPGGVVPLVWSNCDGCSVLFCLSCNQSHFLFKLAAKNFKLNFWLASPMSLEFEEVNFTDSLRPLTFVCFSPLIQHDQSLLSFAVP